MPISTSVNADELVVRITGDIDHHSAPALRDAMDAAIARCMPRTLCLDFAQVSFMDSSGIGLVMGRYRLMKSYGGSVSIVNLSRSEMKLMKMSGIEKIARIKESETCGKS